MKRIIALVAFIIPLFCFGQGNSITIDYKSIYLVKDDGAHFIEVVNCDSALASELFDKAVTWLYKSFKSPKSVIQTENKDLGLIVVKGWFVSEFVQTEYKLTIQVKDGRFRYDISDIMVHYDNPYGVDMPSKRFVEFKADMDKDGPEKWIHGAQEFFDPVLVSLKREMTSIEEEW